MALDKEATTWRYKYEDVVRAKAQEIVQLNAQHAAAVQRLERQITEIKDASEEGLAYRLFGLFHSYICSL